MVSILLKNNSTEVIVSLIENMHSLIEIVKGNTTAIEEKILPALTTLSGDKTWRIRLAIVNFMPKLAPMIGCDLFTIKLQQVLINLLMDSVFTIREAAADSLIKLAKDSYTQVWLQDIFTEELRSFSRHERFMIRIQTVHFIMKLREEVSKETLNKNFVEVLLLLIEDPVPNIRFNVCKAIEAVYPKLTPGNKIKCEQAVKKMESDKDFDVQYFAK
jgi:serine/threonine-protein phosphatase 2A regulatory subunit A